MGGLENCCFLEGWKVVLCCMKIRIASYHRRSYIDIEFLCVGGWLVGVFFFGWVDGVYTDGKNSTF